MQFNYFWVLDNEGDYYCNQLGRFILLRGGKFTFGYRGEYFASETLRQADQYIFDHCTPYK